MNDKLFVAFNLEFKLSVKSDHGTRSGSLGNANGDLGACGEDHGSERKGVRADRSQTNNVCKGMGDWSTTTEIICCASGGG